MNSTKRRVTPEIERVPMNEILIVLLSIALFTVLVYMWMGSRQEKRRKK